MKYQSYICNQIDAAAVEFFKYAKGVAPDKLEWSPLDHGRSALDQCREIAMCPTWAVQIVNGEALDWGEETMAQIKEEQSHWTTVADCEAEFAKRAAEMRTVFEAFPDERLEETRFMPFDGGRDFTFIEMMDYPRWNLNYHTGQVAYIQTLYGDGAMY